MREHLAGSEIRGIWQIGLSPAASFHRQLRYDGLPKRLRHLLAADAVQYLLWLLSWWMIGRNVPLRRPSISAAWIPVSCAGEA